MIENHLHRFEKEIPFVRHVRSHRISLHSELPNRVLESFSVDFGFQVGRIKVFKKTVTLTFLLMEEKHLYLVVSWFDASI